jgi:hypothetical membrane protein
MTTTYFALVVALLAAASGLAKTLNNTRLARVAWRLFIVAAAAVFLAGVFPMDFPGPVQSLSGRLHLLGGMVAFPTMAIGALLFSLSSRREPAWKSASILALALSAAVTATYPAALLSLAFLGFAGYLQRLYVCLFTAWLLVIGRHLIRLATTSASAVPGG